MPFDGIPPAGATIAEIKAAIRHARAQGRLMCDNPDKFAWPTPTRVIDGISYVCALAAVYPAGYPWWNEGPDVEEFCKKVLTTHDSLLLARRWWWLVSKRRVAKLERRFEALVA